MVNHEQPASCWPEDLPSALDSTVEPPMAIGHAPSASWPAVQTPAAAPCKVTVVELDPEGAVALSANLESDPDPPPDDAGRPRLVHPERTAWGIGATVSGRYRLLDLLGQGGMGDVYLAEDQFLRKRVALKALQRNMAKNPKALERFRQEVAMAHEVIHPGLARTFDLGKAGGVTYLTMEFLEGENLEDRLRKHGPPPLPEVQRIAVQIARALEAAHHEGVIHRDLKPSNIHLTPERGAVVLDFGLAAAAGEMQAGGAPAGSPTPRRYGGSHSELARVSSDVAGTPAYMAPEQWQGLPQGVATDIYAFGGMLFEMLTGRPPFEGATPLAMMMAHLQQEPPSPHAVRTEVPRHLDLLVRQCLAKEPERRPASMGEVAARIAGPDTWRHVVTAVMACAALLAVTICGWILYQSSSMLLLREMRPAVLAAAENLAYRLTLDGSAQQLPAIRRGPDVGSAAYRQVWMSMHEVVRKNPRIQYAYVLRLKTLPHDWEDVVDTDCHPGGSPCPDDSRPGFIWDGSQYPALAEVVRTRSARVEDDFISDLWGITLSGYAPIALGTSETYIVGVDQNNETLLRLRNIVLTIFFLLGLAAAVLIAVFRRGRQR